MTALAALLTSETELVSQFISVLKQEQDALKLGKADALAAINAEKMVLVEQLNQIGIERSALADMTGTGTDRATMLAWLEKNPQEKESVSLWVKLLKLAQEAKAAEVKQLDSNSQAWMELQANTLDAVVIDQPVAMYYLKQGAGKDLKIVGTQKDGSGMVFAFKKDNKQLQEGVNKALKELKANGTYDKIYEKWFGKPASK